MDLLPATGTTAANVQGSALFLQKLMVNFLLDSATLYKNENHIILKSFIALMA